MVIEAEKKTFDEHIKKLTIVDFYTTGCPSCEKLSPIFEQMSERRTNLSFLKVNLDKDVTLAERYSISHVPTVILFCGGRPLRVQTGIMDALQLAAFIDGEEVCGA